MNPFPEHKQTNNMKKLTIILLSFTVLVPSMAQTAYQRPPQDIVDMLTAKPVPTAIFNSSGTLGVVSYKDSPLMPISEIVNMDEYKVGGLRINANNFSDSRYKTITSGISLVKVPDGAIVEIDGIPSGAKISSVKWSPDGKVFCFLNTTDYSVDLYRVDATAKAPVAERINTMRVNNTYGAAFCFMPDGKSIIYKAVPSNIGQMPSDRTPKGPIVQRSNGKPYKYRTYQDLVKSLFDEDVYEYLCGAQLCVWNNGLTRIIGDKAVFRSFDPSPDGNFLLVVVEKRPYSYVRSHLSFGAWTSVWDITGKEVKVLKKSISAGASKSKKDTSDVIVTGNVAEWSTGAPDESQDGFSDEDAKKTTTTKSFFCWRPDEPATVAWIETEVTTGSDEDNKDDDDKDSRDDDKEKEEKPEPTYTTSLWQFEYPFLYKSQKKMLFKSQYKMSNVIWCDEDLAIYTETNSKEKFKRIMAFTPADSVVVAEEIFRYSTEHDTVGNAPVYGEPLKRTDPGTCASLLWVEGSTMFLKGDNRPDAEGDNMSFIDAFNIRSGKITNLWTGKAPYNEVVAKVVGISPKGVTFISRKQSCKEVPNYCLVTVKGGKESSVRFTDFENPLPQMLDIQDSFVTYRRADGLKMSGRLYLPAGYDKERDGKLPVLLWTYPYEYQCPAEAEKFRVPRYTYPVPGRAQLMHWATKGYAVLMGFSMPIVAKTLKGKPNDTLVEQMVMNAEAAINYLDSIGVGDRNRVAVGGHSYGSFMTANLMTHTTWFKAGFAESGAHNRSLTPFGFQHEGRTYWKAKKMYNKVSPFNYADSLSGHLLLIHGTMDENAGTHPIQSERMYYAAAGCGKDVDYLQLPFEGHTYVFEENVLHNANEQWKALEKYVKNAKKPEE